MERKLFFIIEVVLNDDSKLTDDGVLQEVRNLLIQSSEFKGGRIVAAEEVVLEADSANIQ